MKRFFCTFLSLVTMTLPATAQKNTYSLLLHWYPQAQFAGYYYALEKGYYKEQDLNIEILYGTVTLPSTQLIRTGDFDFAILWLSTAMQLRAAKVPVRHLAQTNQSSALLLVSHKGRGVDRLEDFNGKKIGIWSGDFELQPLSLLKRNNIEMQVININNSINLFLRGGIDVCTAMWYNEYHEMLSAGLREEDLNVFRMSEYGMNFPEDGIYAHERLAWNRPGICRKFVEASLRGWMTAFQDVEGTLDILEKACTKAGVPFSRAHQRWMLNCFRELLIHPRTGKIETVLPVKAYDFVGSVLLERNFIKSIPPYETFTATL
ncbi:MAG: ABC transporter substrate-binding protein [Bacteroidales bacterium]|nr:ABC transporter substrate-binding protein [Bacteroidales bacterium]MDD2263589.1 ABC transporter substrate-binding protein [Bacteroidales bacterium]MDD2830620.1 ABC transporter substrate-binding protein [Bacteroidales bacterium]MDD3208889.1 ABC transporter substrate-binding protein [Bacteroidales bacterium]MDD3697386.1 ABC transporter substrate-binding protein [Bacteroidales bacterium]